MKQDGHHHSQHLMTLIGIGQNWANLKTTKQSKYHEPLINQRLLRTVPNMVDALGISISSMQCDVVDM